VIHHGCCGGVIIGPSKDDRKDDGKGRKDDGKGKKGGEEAEEDKGASEGSSAKIIVSLPAEAKLKIQGQDTKATGAERTFVTPKLTQGKYSWTLEVETMQNGKPVTWAKTVSFRSGETQRVTLAAPAQIVKK